MSHHLPDATKMISDTPRTDARLIEGIMLDGRVEQLDRVYATFARTLERELNAANVEIEEKRKDVVWLATEKAKLENYVMRLEEAGHELLYDNDNMENINRWHKAKEAKL